MITIRSEYRFNQMYARVTIKEFAAATFAQVKENKKVDKASIKAYVVDGPKDIRIPYTPSTILPAETASFVIQYKFDPL